MTWRYSNRGEKIKTLTDIEKAYIAGIFDGEGCAGVYRIKSKNNIHPYNFGIRIVITNTNFPLICWLKEKIGVGCAHEVKRSYKPEWNKSHRYQIVGEQARSFLKMVYPHLIIKRKIVDVVMSMPIYSKRFARNRGRSEIEYENQAEIYELSKAMNKRGIA